MNLIKDKWTENDGKDFQKFLELKENKDKVEWTKKIINTSMPCLAIKTGEINEIVKQIFKGNYLSYIDLWLWKYYENTSIIGCLLNNIKDFSIFKNYLDVYSEKADNWATCDIIKFNNKNFFDNYIKLSKEYIKSTLPFKRRLGIDALFKLVDNDKYINEIFIIMNGFENETEYYVNMVLAWLFAECFTKQREKTLNYLQTHKLNKFVINKGIQKCRDSFRISSEDKDMLLKYKRK